MYLPNHLELASGRTSLLIKVNALLLIIYIPVLFIIVPQYGVAGAATLWTVLGLVRFIIVPFMIHKNIFTGITMKWYVNDFAAIVMPILGGMLFVSVVKAGRFTSAYGLLFYFMAICIASLLFVVFTQPIFRDYIKQFVGKRRKSC
jgi:O-antigen/teichoic acid export membrane protein